MPFTISVEAAATPGKLPGKSASILVRRNLYLTLRTHPVPLEPAPQGV
jgi:hypothetical protein